MSPLALHLISLRRLRIALAVTVAGIATCSSMEGSDDVRLIAHRGGVVNEELIENNLPAIEEAIRRGYFMLEVDVRRSRDGRPVVHHDEDFQRFYGDERRVDELVWGEIKKIRARVGDVRPLLFTEFCRACSGRIRLMLDVKGPDHDEAFFREMRAALEENDLLESALLIGTEQSQQFFGANARIGVDREKLAAAIAAEEPVGERYFLFEHGVDLDARTVATARAHGVIVVPSINTFHYEQATERKQATADVRRLRRLGVTYFQIDSVYEDVCREVGDPAVIDPRLNEIQVVGSHNSYHIAPEGPILQLLAQRSTQLAQSLDYTHRPLGEQFTELGVRQIELDVFADPEGGLYANPAALRLAAAAGAKIAANDDPLGFMQQPGFKVLHVQDIDFRTTALTLVDALQQVKTWSRQHPRHVPIMILIEAKQDAIGAEFTQPVAFDRRLIQSIDDEILAIFSDEEILAPDDVRGDFATLGEAIAARGWPRLSEVRGRVLFALDNGGEVRDHYLEGNETLEGRLLFVSVDADHPAAAFQKLNDPIGDFDAIAAAVERGMIVRTRADAGTKQSREHDALQREMAFASGAQFVSTDYAEPDDRFSPYAVRLPGDVVTRTNPLVGDASLAGIDLE